MENSFSCEFEQSGHHWEVQLKLFLLFCQLNLRYCLFLLLLFLPNCPWNGPVMYRYVFLFASFFIELIMLMDMQATSRVSSLKKGLAFSMCFDEFLVNSEHYVVSNFSYAVY